MLESDREKGKAILILISTLFLYYSIWVIGLPFIDDSRLCCLFYNHNVALLIPAIFGFCFIGGLVLFTVYHVRPHLAICKSPEKYEKCVYYNKM